MSKQFSYKLFWQQVPIKTRTWTLILLFEKNSNILIMSVNYIPRQQQGLNSENRHIAITLQNLIIREALFIFLEFLVKCFVTRNLKKLLYLLILYPLIYNLNFTQRKSSNAGLRLFVIML